ncbi:CpaF family protein [uncultured Phascolarctobacterium sp.]|jgi:pilus assembly protein CpaF|uniref:CpaF family protein n=1 Tax=uncultured Phascolarctobacterium sp. TaxID=512296 RepID=UPI0025E27234|nr:CpaF family protein [uncultured Phascolarctobacterium sp.]
MSLTERLNRKNKKFVAAPSASGAATAKQKQGTTGFSVTADEAREKEYQTIKSDIHAKIIDEMPEALQRAINQSTGDQKEVRRMVENICAEEVRNNPFAVPLGDRERLVDELISEIMGLGPIEPFLQDSSVSEVMVNGPDSIYIERSGHLIKTETRFRNAEHLMHIIDRIVSAVGRRVDESSPMVDARLLDGSRVNVIIPPLSLIGPCLTIRKFSRDVLTVDKMIEFGSFDERMAQFLEACVRGRLNIVVSGGTGSGKTTLLNVLSSYVPESERIVTLEDSAELQLHQDNLVTLETRPANIEGEGEISMRDLVRNALRMRPDRIIVGEVRTGEALDMLQAMNTGHDGSMTTAHANSARDLLSRLETMVLMSGMELPLRAIRSQIASAVDIVVQIARMRDGSRKIINISEVTGMEGDIITMQDLFRFEQQGIDSDGRLRGEFVSEGLRPMCSEKLELNGIHLPMELFS